MRDVLSGDQVDQAHELVAICQTPDANPNAAFADINLEILQEVSQYHRCLINLGQQPVASSVYGGLSSM